MKQLLLIALMWTPLSTILAQDALQAEHEVNVSFTVPKTNIIDIASLNGNDITFSPTEIASIADGANFSLTNSELWLNYTVIKANAFSPKRINVSVDAINFPTGMSLKLKVDPDEGQGKGDMGTPVAGYSELVPDAAPVELITDIGSCYTGNGPNNGHNLHFQLDYDNTFYDELQTNFNTVIILTYTITD